MGIHRTPDELKPEIINGTLKIIARGGMDNFSFPKLTAETGISAPTVYEHYKNKEELLTTCFLTIDREISKRIEKALAEFPSELKSSENFMAHCRLLWHSYWNYNISNSERAIFYWHFFNSVYYSHAIQDIHRDNFKMLRNFIEASKKNATTHVECNTDLLVAHMINATAAYVSKTLRGFYKNDTSTEETVYHMVFQPIYAALGIYEGQTQNSEKTKIKI